MTFNQRYCTYGSTTSATALADKDFLHSHLSLKDARGYVEKYSEQFKGRYEQYDIYVAGELKERIEINS